MRLIILLSRAVRTVTKGGGSRNAALVGPPSTGVTALEIDGRYSIYNPISRRVLTLNQTASDVWRLCDGEADEESIAGFVAAAYGQPVDGIRDAVLATIDLFEGEGLLTSPRATSVPE